MKLILRHILLFVAVCVLLSVTVSASEVHNMVYESKEKQEEIFNMFDDSKYGFDKFGVKCYYVEETLTPVYTFSMLDYAKSESLELYHANDGTRYVLKVVTEDGDFAGNSEFRLNGSTLLYGGMSYAPPILQAKESDTSSYKMSCSYADHAERIRVALGKKELIPAQNVKYVIIDWVGHFFCIEDNGEYIFILVGRGDYPENDAVSKEAYILTEEDVLKAAKAYAEKYEAYVAKIEKWEAEHPGETYPPVDGGAPVPEVSGTTVEASAVNNITDIYGYLGLEHTYTPELNNGAGDAEPSPETDYTWYIVAGVGALAIVALASGAYIVTKKRR